jgi:glycogen debranching enzyme
MTRMNDILLKEDYAFLTLDPDGNARDKEQGFYCRDTRFLREYGWHFSVNGQGFDTLLSQSPRADHLHAHYARLNPPRQYDEHGQIVGISRKLSMFATGFEDSLTVSNTSQQRQEVVLELTLASDFADIFEVRGWPAQVRTIDHQVSERQQVFTYKHTAVTVRSSQAGEVTAAGWRFVGVLAPNETYQLTITAHVNGLPTQLATINYDTWRAQFSDVANSLDQRDQSTLNRAVDDLRSLLLFTEQGAVPAAGIPRFVSVFGRDSLLTAFMLLPFCPEVARSTLRYLASLQGQEVNTFRSEAPGKILHEVRHGELSQQGVVPFARYYGSADATSLFVMLLAETTRVTQDDGVLLELRPHWEAALAWLTRTGDAGADADGDGFLEFAGSAGEGLKVQSWKDSYDALSHADGSLATGAIAVSEVQGYAYAAFRAAADFYAILNEPKQQQAYDERAERLQQAFHEAFWVDELQTYALALDGDKRPLKVQNSDAGQLLWTGIVPEDVAPLLVETLFNDANWSGWGIRTLGKFEKRYNPLSYHNGSVWGHDNALTAGGLARYGFFDEVQRIREALYAVAGQQSDVRLPELFGGYAEQVVPYPAACRVQAWDAAALVYLAHLCR